MVSNFVETLVNSYGFFEFWQVGSITIKRNKNIKTHTNTLEKLIIYCKIIN